MVLVSEVVDTDAALVVVTTLEARDATCDSPTSDVSVCPGEEDARNISSVFISVSGDDISEAAVIPSTENMEAI